MELLFGFQPFSSGGSGTRGDAGRVSGRRGVGNEPAADPAGAADHRPGLRKPTRWRSMIRRGNRNQGCVVSDHVLGD